MLDPEALAQRIEQTAREEWARVVIRREFREGEPDNAGSSYWDGRQAAFREAARMVREAGGAAP